MSTANVVWAAEPGWLTKKRQLAQALEKQFPPFPDQDQWLPWQAGSQNNSNGWLKGRCADYIAEPLQQAVQDYSDFLQENLMEKGIKWQDNQLFAAHLAQLDGGQFIYVPDNRQVSTVLRFTPRGTMTNPHNVIIVGANSRATIEEKMLIKSAQPLFAATELLVGANAQVSFRQDNQLRAPQLFQGLNIYQAQGAHVTTDLNLFNEGKVAISYSNFLDGDDSQWDARATLKPGHFGSLHLIPKVSGTGQQSRAQLVTRVAEQFGGRVKVKPFAVASGSTVTASEQTISATK